MIRIKNNLDWWKHNAIIFSPVWVTGVVLLVIGTELEIAGEYIGTIIFDFIVLAIVFMVISIIKNIFIREKGIKSTNKSKTVYFISVILGMIVLFSNQSSFDLLIAALAAVTLYLTQFKTFASKPI